MSDDIFYNDLQNLPALLMKLDKIPFDQYQSDQIDLPSFILKLKLQKFQEDAENFLDPFCFEATEDPTMLNLWQELHNYVSKSLFNTSYVSPQNWVNLHSNISIFKKEIELSKNKDIRRIYIYEDSKEAAYLLGSKGVNIQIEASKNRKINKHHFQVKFIKLSDIEENKFINNSFKQIPAEDFAIIDNNCVLFSLTDNYRITQKMKISLDSSEIKVCKNFYENAWKESDDIETFKKKNTLTSTGTLSPVGTDYTTEKPKRKPFKIFRITKKIVDSIKSQYNIPNLLQIYEKEIKYIAQEGTSKNMIIFFHGLGLDHRDYIEYFNTNFQDTLIAATLLGFYPEDEPIKLSLETHSRLMVEFINSMADNYKPERIILVGFSTGANIAFDVAKYMGNKIYGLISLDCDLNYDTCFISQRVSKIDPNKHGTMFDAIKQISQSSDIDDLRYWLMIHTYLVKIFNKFQDKIDVLKDISDQSLQIYKGKKCTAFVNNYKSVIKTCKLKCIFSGIKENSNIVEKVLSNLYKTKILKDGTINYIKDQNHFDLISPTNLNHFISEMTGNTEDLNKFARKNEETNFLWSSTNTSFPAKEKIPPEFVSGNIKNPVELIELLEHTKKSIKSLSDQNSAANFLALTNLQKFRNILEKHVFSHYLEVTELSETRSFFIDCHDYIKHDFLVTSCVSIDHWVHTKPARIMYEKEAELASAKGIRFRRIFIYDDNPESKELERLLESDNVQFLIKNIEIKFISYAKVYSLHYIQDVLEKLDDLDVGVIDDNWAVIHYINKETRNIEKVRISWKPSRVELYKKYLKEVWHQSEKTP